MFRQMPAQISKEFCEIIVGDVSVITRKDAILHITPFSYILETRAFKSLTTRQCSMIMICVSLSNNSKDESWWNFHALVCNLSLTRSFPSVITNEWCVHICLNRYHRNISMISIQHTFPRRWWMIHGTKHLSKLIYHNVQMGEYPIPDKTLGSFPNIS